MKTISIISMWLSRIGIFCAVATIIGPFTSKWIGIDWEFLMLVFGLCTILIGSTGMTLGLIGNLKKHEYQKNAQKGFKYGAYSLLLLIIVFISLVIKYVLGGGGPV